MGPMWEHWWPWVAGVTAFAIIAVRALVPSRRPSRIEESPPDGPVCQPEQRVAWTPHDPAMDPVSGWPHTLNRPDQPTNHSPLDRGDLNR